MSLHYTCPGIYFPSSTVSKARYLSTNCQTLSKSILDNGHSMSNHSGPRTYKQDSCTRRSLSGVLNIISCLDRVPAQREMNILLVLLFRLQRHLTLRTISTPWIRSSSVSHLGQSPPDRTRLLWPEVKWKVFLVLVVFPEILA